MRLILASNNRHKTEELAKLAQHLGFDIVNYQDVLGECLDFPAESRDSQDQNALTKARFIHQYLPEEAVIADDSGLYLAAFPDRFGVTTSRDLKAAGAKGQPAENEYLLSILKGKERAAYLLTSLAYLGPDGQEGLFHGRGGVRISENIRGGDFLGGMDDIVEAENGKTLSEMSPDEVVAYHQRSRALSELKDFLSKD
ncbi:non-canonical purine NTP pyrophosphatase [Eupransor demetentiae]|uniref:All-alpha NTP-PPase family (RdgB) n=1 Tax=Eupransor demetentiae TaxID=3109584 RepID=A0ABP0EPT6_9LACO|nr:Inosine/xanthosine triphosphate pyrophosphatase [Lactobacillaceae bacterium LMG 33000]